MKRFVAGLFLTMMIFTTFAGSVSTVYAVTENVDSVQVGKGTYNPYEKCTGWGLDKAGCSLGVLLIYGLWFRITNFLAEAAGNVADFFLWYSLQSSVYRKGELMTVGWTVVRDLVNIGFIIALVFVALSLIWNNGSSYKTLIKIIISALLINFSLMGARIIIDAGNIVARALYQHIKSNNAEVGNTIKGLNGQMQVSRTVLEMMNPQRILFKDSNVNDADFFWQMLVMFFMAGLLNIALIFVFATMAILFIARTVGLIILAILVPLSIVVDLIPWVKKQIQGIKGIGSVLSFTEWFSQYIKLSATAPIYVFFLYLIIGMQASFSALGNVIEAAGSGSSLAADIMNVLLPSILLLFMFKIATEITKEMAGAVGGIIMGAVVAGIGAVGGIALAGLTAGASRVGGAVGRAKQRSAAANMTEEKQAERKAKIETAQGKGWLQGKIAQARYGDKRFVNRAKQGQKMAEEYKYDLRGIQAPGWVKRAGKATGISSLVEGTGLVGAFGEADKRTYKMRDEERGKTEIARHAKDNEAIQAALTFVQAERKAAHDKMMADDTLGTGKGGPKDQMEQQKKANADGKGVPAASGGIRAENPNDVLDKTNALTTQKKDLKDLQDDYDNSKAPTPAQWKKIQDKRVEIEREEKELKELEFRVNNRGGTSIDGLKAELSGASAAIAAAEEAAEGLRLRRKAALEAPTKPSQAEMMAMDGLAQNAKEEIQSRREEKAKIEQAIKAREEKSVQIQKDIDEKKYLTDDPAAVAHAKTLQETKDRYMKEKDPEKKRRLTNEIIWQSDYVRKYSPVDPVTGGPMDREAFLASDAGRVYSASLEGNMIKQFGLDKDLMSFMYTEATIEHMKNAFDNMGRTMVTALTAGLGAAALTVFTGGAGAAALPALWSIVAGGLTAGGEAAYRGIRNTTVPVPFGFERSRNQNIEAAFRQQYMKQAA